MSPFPLSLLTLLLLTTFIGPTTPTPTPTTDLVAELTHLRSSSPTTVIHLSDHLLSRLLSLPTPRPFSCLIFFDAKQLHSKSELQLPTLLTEFSLLSSSFLLNNPNHNHHSPSSSHSSLFFFDIEFKDSQRSFSLFSVNSLPHIRLILPTTTDLKSSPKMDPADISRLSDGMAQFVETHLKDITIGPIHRPPMFSTKQIIFFFICIAIWSPFAVRKAIKGETLLHDYKIWLFGAVFVYFFSVAGTMHNIIRKMPMFIADREDPSRMQYFYQGSGMQLGAEGFAVGFLYTVVGVLLGFVTHVLVRVRDLRVQRFLMVVALIVSFWAVKKVVFLDNWKTGYGVHAYWPTSWRF